MKASSKKKHYDNIIFILMFIFFVSTIIEIFAYKSFKNESYQRKRNEVMTELMDIRADMEREINSTVMLIGGLSVYAQVNPDITKKEFEEYAKNLYQKSPYIRNIALAPNNKIEYVYPLEGNKEAIGLNLNNHPQQKYAVQLMMQRKKPIIAGPERLVQGGVALICRIPIYIIEDGQEKYWGMTSIPINIEEIYKESGVYEKQDKLEIAIRGKDGLGESGIVFFGKPYVFREDPVEMDISLGYGKWRIAAIPKDGWSIEKDDMKKPLLLLLINILILGLVGLVVDQSEKNLKYQTELSNSEEKYRILASNSNDIIWTINLDETITYVSPSLENQFYIKVKELEGKKLLKFLGPDQYKKFKTEVFENYLRGEKIKDNYFEMCFFHPKLLWLGTKVSELIDDNGKTIGFLCISRDVTESRRLKEEFEKMATTDYLTSLYNRRKFNEIVELEIKKLQRYGGEFSILMFDIDFFKKVNDTYGHKTGDLVLKDIAKISLCNIRESDIAARYGGEEFIIGLFNTNMDSAKIFAERLRVSIEENTLSFMGEEIKVTVSIGVSSFRKDITMDELIIRADQALYEAKRRGRNMVVDETKI